MKSCQSLQAKKTDGITILQKELESRGVGFKTSEKITKLKDELKKHEKKTYIQFLQTKLEDLGVQAGDRKIVEMIECLKNEMKERDMDFNSAWEVDVEVRIYSSAPNRGDWVLSVYVNKR